MNLWWCYTVHDVANEAVARRAVPRLPARQRLLAAASAGPSLWPAISTSFDDDPSWLAVAVYLRGWFPPAARVPVVPPGLLAPVREIAMGKPGDPVAYGCV